MKKLLFIFFIALSMGVNAQNEDLKEFNKYNNLDSLRAIIGSEVLAFPRVENSAEFSYPVEIFKNGRFIKADFETYQNEIAGKYFKIITVDDSNYWHDITFKNNFNTIKWGMPKNKNLTQKIFISKFWVDKINALATKEKIIYANNAFDYDTDSLYSPISAQNLISVKGIVFPNSDNKFQRFKAPTVYYVDNKGSDSYMDAFKFDFDKVYKAEDFDRIFKNQERIYNDQKNRTEGIEKKIKSDFENKLRKKYSAAITKRIINGEVWIGMTREMLFESKGSPTRIGITTETADMYSVQYIYESRLFGTEFIYVDNGKVTAIQSY